MSDENPEDHTPLHDAAAILPIVLETIWSKTARAILILTSVLVCIMVVEAAVVVCLFSLTANQQASITNQKAIAETYNERLKDVGTLLALIKEEETTRLSGDSDFGKSWETKVRESTTYQKEVLERLTRIEAELKK